MKHTLQQIKESIELANAHINDIVYEYTTSQLIGDREVHTTYDGEDAEELVKRGSVQKHSLTADKYVAGLVENKDYTALSHGFVYLTFPIHRFTEYKKYMFTEGSRCFTTPKALYVTTNYGLLIKQGWVKDMKYISDCTKYHEIGTNIVITTDDAKYALSILNNNTLLCSTKLHNCFCELYISGFMSDIISWLCSHKINLIDHIKSNSIVYEEYKKQAIKDSIANTIGTN